MIGCVLAGVLAWFVRGRGLDALDSEHFFAFAIGIIVAIRLPSKPLRWQRETGR